MKRLNLAVIFFLISCLVTLNGSQSVDGEHSKILPESISFLSIGLNDTIEKARKKLEEKGFTFNELMHFHPERVRFVLNNSRAAKLFLDEIRHFYLGKGIYLDYPDLGKEYEKYRYKIEKAIFATSLGIPIRHSYIKK